MNGLRLLRRLRAYGEGKPLPYGRTKHLEMPPGAQVLLVAFLRMGGETAPWGIGWKRPGQKPKFVTVPEPRDRELVLTRYEPGCGVADAAERTGRSMEAAYKALNRLRKLLHDCVTHTLAQPHPGIRGGAV